MEVLPKWNLNSLFSCEKEAIESFKSIKNLLEEFINKYKEKLTNLNSKELFECLKCYETLCEQLGRAGTYAYLVYVTEMQNEEKSAFYQQISEMIAECSAKLSFFTIELNSLPEEILKQKELEFFAPFIKNTRIFKPYELKPELEEMLIRKSVTSSDAWIRFYDETLSNLKFKLNGKEVSIAIILNALSSIEEKERKEAAKELGKVLEKNIKTISFIINAIIKDKQIEDEYRGFKNSIDSRNLSNFVEREVVESLIQSVKESYPELSHKYYKLKAKIFNKETLKYWDRNAPLPFDGNKTFTFKEAKEITLNSYKQFHPKMAEVAELFFKNNWIDAEAKEGKDSGAFSHPAVPSANPFIMLNFLGKIRDVATMAHELGHGVHQFLARKNGALMAGTPLTLAETASVFGEMLVFQNLLKTASSKEEKLAMLGSKIEDMLNTVVRQIAFCDFETILHEKRKQGELTPDFICKTWLKVQKESLGEGISFEDEYKHFWGYISHFFHAPFYVYAYAFGDCLVNSLYSIYRSQSVLNFEEKYLEMLSKGGTMHHSELLAPFDIDLKSKTFWKEGLNLLKIYINEFESLL